MTDSDVYIKAFIFGNNVFLYLLLIFKCIYAFIHGCLYMYISKCIPQYFLLMTKSLSI